MSDRDDELKPGVDKPRRREYLVGALVILLLAALAYWGMG
jgi:hypothetical protein